MARNIFSKKPIIKNNQSKIAKYHRKHKAEEVRAAPPRNEVKTMGERARTGELTEVRSDFAALCVIKERLCDVKKSRQRWTDTHPIGPTGAENIERVNPGQKTDAEKARDKPPAPLIYKTHSKTKKPSKFPIQNK